MDILRCVTGPYATNCYILADGTSATIIDPGLGASALVESYISENSGVVLRDIVLTHGHLDHTCEAAAVARRYGAVVRIHQADAFMLDHGAGLPLEMRNLFHADHMEEPDSLEFLADGDTLDLAGTSFQVRHAPGHSPGCVMLVGDEMVLSGDVLFRGSVGRVDLPFSDPEAMAVSLKEVVYPLDDALVVLPGHGDSTTMLHEKQYNPFLEGLV